MSAFFVQDAVIDDVVDLLASPGAEPGREFGTILGKALWSMNLNALEQRYPDVERDDYVEQIVNYEWQPSDVGDVQRLKSLACFLYQCTEGNVPDTRLYQMLNAVEKALVERLCKALGSYIAFDRDQPNGYDAALWDRPRKFSA